MWLLCQANHFYLLPSKKSANSVHSKAQYETRLKRWGFRKYASKEQWNAIHHAVDNRHAQGKGSQVYLHGEPLKKEKIEKERRRRRRQAIPFTDPCEYLVRSRQEVSPGLTLVSSVLSANAGLC